MSHPLVEAMRLESLLNRQRRVVLKLAAQLDDAEALRVILEAELGRVKGAVEPVVYDYRPQTSPADSPGGSSLGAHGEEGRVELGQVVPDRASGGVPTTPDPSVPDAGGDARPGTARMGGSTARGVTDGESPVTSSVGAGDAATREGAGAPVMRAPSSPAPRRSFALTKDETGNRYGNLVVIEAAHTGRPGAHWRCGCDCGAETVVRGTELRRGYITKCSACSGRRTQRCGECGQGGHNSRSCPATRVYQSQTEPLIVVPPPAPAPAPSYRRPRVSSGVVSTSTSSTSPLGKRTKVCALCGSLPHRVTGASCRACGLAFEPEPTSRASDFTGSASALARAI